MSEGELLAILRKLSEVVTNELFLPHLTFAILGEQAAAVDSAQPRVTCAGSDRQRANTFSERGFELHVHEVPCRLPSPRFLLGVFLSQSDAHFSEFKEIIFADHTAIFEIEFGEHELQLHSSLLLSERARRVLGTRAAGSQQGGRSRPQLPHRLYAVSDW